MSSRRDRRATQRLERQRERADLRPAEPSSQPAESTPARQGDITATVAMLNMQIRQGSVLSVGELRELNELIPNGAERWLEEFEAQGAHRRSLETKVVDAGIASQRHGRWSATLLGLIGEGGGFWLVGQGHDAVGIASIIGATATLGGVFLYGRWRAEKDQEAKRDSLAQQLARREGAAPRR